MSDFTTPATVIERDRYGRPLIKPADGGKAVAYTRMTTFIDCLDDRSNLEKWKMRKVAQGLSTRPDLLLAISSLTDPDGGDKRALNDIVEQALDAANHKGKATIGTALHKYAERINLGETVDVPAEYRADIEAYKRATAGLQVIATETLLVLDEYRVAGTPDMLAIHNGRLKVVDLKTGSIEWGMGKIAMQLGGYANSLNYDPATGARTPLGDIDLTEAVVIHMPAGEGRCELVPVDIARGWAAFPLAQQVRDWRKAKWPTTPLQSGPDLASLIGIAATADDLRNLWAAHQDLWSDELTQLAAQRIQALAA